jgi:hypothetical protein
MPSVKGELHPRGGGGSGDPRFQPLPEQVRVADEVCELGLPPIHRSAIAVDNDLEPLDSRQHRIHEALP